MVDNSSANPVPPRPVETGTPSYYLDRLADFNQRCPQQRPPSYYADYGNKCLGQFLATKPTLSPRGQRWVDDTMELLQEMMEQKRRDNELGFASLELDDDAFREFAFGTHSRAYRQAGVFDLGVADLLKIVRTPDVADVLCDEGLKETAQLVLGSDAVGLDGVDIDLDSLGAGVLAKVSRSTRLLRAPFRRLLRRRRT